MDSTAFLRQFVQGYAELSDEELAAIADFTFLWSAMEGLVLQANASPTSLVAAVNALAQAGRLNLAPFEESLAYFRNRYFQGGEFTHHFDKLLFRRPDRRPLVEAVLKGEDEEPAHIVGALLLIVYRLRNNLFHGEKWAYGIRGQHANFRHASDVLMRLIELHRE
ncbi:hypothetical protein [Cupriavidus sp. amp6]|uniref:hypothetical protein n=1 Tax=Cupriavidus sp. amp6 TaxID=388051 RepID=UPI000687FE4A|nr:hypothetical protein [Cupriavidus sp. amp6]